MTSNIAVALEIPAAKHRARYLLGFAIASLLATSMVWSLQKLIQTSEPEVTRAITGSVFDVSTVKTGFELKGFQSTVAEPVLQPQSVQYDGVPTPSYQVKGVLAIPRSEVRRGGTVTAGFSLGVSGGNYGPIIQVKKIDGQYRVRKAKSLPRVDGYCTTQNPVPRVGAVRESTILKGNCPTGNS